MRKHIDIKKPNKKFVILALLLVFISANLVYLDFKQLTPVAPVTKVENQKSPQIPNLPPPSSYQPETPVYPSMYQNINVELVRIYDPLGLISINITNLDQWPITLLRIDYNYSIVWENTYTLEPKGSLVTDVYLGNYTKDFSLTVWYTVLNSTLYFTKPLEA